MFALNCNYKEILLDEIALDGLEGVTLSNLWIHVEQRLALSNPISESLKNRFWNSIITFDCLSFYALRQDVPDIKPCDRFSFIDPKTGVLYEPDEPINEFELCPIIPNEYGVCRYKKRKNVSQQKIQHMSYQEVVEKWNKSLVIVASLEERWKALAGHISSTYLRFLQPVHYILLELIGKSRNNGQTTVGRNALSKITPNSKLLFYQRNLLIELGLVMKYRITVCPYIGGPVQQSLLLRLVRYHKGQLIPPPKVGLLYNAMEILKRKPDHRELVSKLRLELGMSCKQFQKLYRRVDVQKYIKMDESQEKPPTKPERSTTNPGNAGKSTKKTHKTSGSDGEVEPKAKIAKLSFPPRYVMLRADDDQPHSSESEDESKDSSSSMKTDYRLGVPLLRQALQKIRNAGERGLTQINLSKLLGTDPYATRGLCRQLTMSKCVEEYLEDKGRQRTTRYICCKQSVDANVSVQYEKEKDILMSHMKDTRTSLKKSKKKEPPNEIENVQIEEFNSFQYNLSDITEVTHFTGIRDNASSFIESLKNSKNLTSLKQLKLANCILNIVKEKPVIIGFHNLNAGIRKSGHFSTIDSKSLKRCALRLADDGQLRIYKIKWPIIKEHFTMLICAPGISKEDHKIGSIYNDICLRSFRSKIANTTQPMNTIVNDMCKYPKYVRARILHETLFSFAYGNNVINNKANLPQGWISLIEVIPHFTFGFVMSHLTFLTEKLITYLKDRIIFEKKINTLPIEVVQALFETNKTILSIKRTVKCLGTLGLLQFTEATYSKFHHSEDSNNLEIYVNRHATLVNTKGTITNESNLQKDKMTFYFETGDDLKDYWKCFKEIALKTVVELENRTVLECKGKITTYEEAAGQDDGSVPGDGLGVAGYHSAYFIELFRQWSMQDKVPIKKKLLELREKPPVGHCPRKKPCLPRKVVPIKRATKKIVKSKKNTKQLTVIKPKTEVVKTKKFMTRTKLMWLPWEDDLIIMARMARFILTGGNYVMGASMCAKICKFVIKTINKGSNKTVMICHRRGVKLDKSLIYASEREKYLAEVHRRPLLCSQYEGIYQRLKSQYKDDQKFSNAIDLKLAELLLAIMKMPTSNSGKHWVDAAANNIHELKQKYYIRKSHQENVFPYGKDNDALVNMLMDAVHMTLHFNPKYKLPNEIFTVFGKYEEFTLRTATNSLYDIKLIARNKKADNTSKSMEESEKLCYDFHYHLSYRYKIHMHDRLPQKHFDDIIDTLSSTESNATSVSSAIFNCALFELLPSELVSLSMKLKNALSNEFTVIDKTPFNKIAVCEVMWHWKRDIGDVSALVNEEVLKNVLNEMERKSVFPKLASSQTNIDNERLAYVFMEKEEQGATINDLLRKCSGTITLPNLKEYLKDLEEKSVVINIGLEEPKWVLNQFSENWLLKVGEVRLKPRPWLHFDGSINKEALVKFSHTILLRTIEIPGLSIYCLAQSLKFLRIAHVREVCELLEKFGCVKIKHLVLRQSKVFDDDYEDEDIYFEEPCFINDPKNMYVFPTYNATVLFSIVKGIIKEIS